jgi:hypothetical protein
MNSLDIVINGVTLAVVRDAEGNTDSIRIGGVEIGALLDTVAVGGRDWWKYFDAVVERELHQQRKESDERSAHGLVGDV